MEQLTISVALATYNGINYIGEQIDSITKQTYAPDEVIISDDGSKDGTVEFVADYIKKHHLENWKIVNNKTEHGVTSNYINALKYCVGDVVFLCDQDDVWVSKKVENTIKIFQSDEDISCVISRIDYLENGRIVKKRTPYTKKKDHTVDLRELLSVCSYLGMSSAFRRAVIVDASRAFMQSTSHDWGLYITAERMGRIAYSGVVCQNYRIHRSNASVINDGSFRENRIKMLNRKLDHMVKTEQVIESDKEQVVNEYTEFMKNRIINIENMNVLRIFFSVFTYYRYGYMTRNIIADIKAASLE